MEMAVVAVRAVVRAPIDCCATFALHRWTRGGVSAHDLRAVRAMYDDIDCRREIERGSVVSQAHGQAA